jgi:hypothetical protein
VNFLKNLFQTVIVLSSIVGEHAFGASRSEIRLAPWAKFQLLNWFASQRIANHCKSVQANATFE